jgi:hypothetical protein
MALVFLLLLWCSEVRWTAPPASAWAARLNPQTRAAQQGERRIRLSGEVVHGRSFQAEIARGLMFELKPVAPQPGAIEGWHITVRAQKAAPGCGDFVSVATPPYRFDNPRYLDTGYGNTARDAVSRTPREFYFALTCADYKRMAAQVKRMLWPDSGPVARQDGPSSIPTGKGQFKILEHKIGPAPKTVEGRNLGRIEWLKFDVEITLPPGFGDPTPR